MSHHVPTCPLLLSPVSCGFPSPAEETAEQALNLHDHVVVHPAATFFVRASGDSMEGAGISPGDILVVDRAREVFSDALVVAVVHGEFLVKRFRREGRRAMLHACHPGYPSIPLGPEDLIWGVVTHVLHHTAP